MGDAIPLNPGGGSGVYLRTYLRPFAAWLERPDVTEILVNRPGEMWVEIAGEAFIEFAAG